MEKDPKVLVLVLVHRGHLPARQAKGGGGGMGLEPRARDRTPTGASGCEGLGTIGGTGGYLRRHMFDGLIGGRVEGGLPAAGDDDVRPVFLRQLQHFLSHPLLRLGIRVHELLHNSTGNREASSAGGRGRHGGQRGRGAHGCARPCAGASTDCNGALSRGCPGTDQRLRPRPVMRDTPIAQPTPLRPLPRDAVTSKPRVFGRPEPPRPLQSTAPHGPAAAPHTAPGCPEPGWRGPVGPRALPAMAYRSGGGGGMAALAPPPNPPTPPH